MSDKEELETIDFLRSRVKEYEFLVRGGYLFIQAFLMGVTPKKEALESHCRKCEEYGLDDLRKQQ